MGEAVEDSALRGTAAALGRLAAFLTSCDINFVGDICGNLRADRPDRMLVHEAARAAGEQGKFWAMHDLLLANQPRQSRADLVGMASQLQLDVARFAADLDSGRYRAAIEADRQQADALGIRNQPTWFLNGARLKGPLTLVELQRLVDAAEK